jgi:NADH-quinone oxidoreductase subunit L
MRFPMGMLAFLAVVGGLLQIPGIDDAITRFLDPTFAGSRLYHLEGSTGADWVGLIIGALIAVAGISIAYRTWVLKPGTSSALQARLARLHTFLLNKWYFDELIDMTVVRPAQWLGRFNDSVLERGVIAGGITGGTTGIVRAASAAVRRAQTGYLRYYAAAMVVGTSGMALYFLISAS